MPATRCPRCRVRFPAPARRWCRECLKKSRALHVKIRRETVAAYGGKCTCCGEIEACFLTVVIDGTTLFERGMEADRGGFVLFQKLKRLGYPASSAKVLCWNCLSARQRVGICPHDTPAAASAPPAFSSGTLS